MRRATAIAVLVLGSILLGALAAGTPVAGNDTVAAVTAGINLGTAPVARIATSGVLSTQVAALRALIGVIRLLLAAATGVGLAAALAIEVPGSLRSLLRARTRALRGPPAPA